jgi:hypothetical protein
MRQPLKHSCHKDLEKVSGSESQEKHCHRGTDTKRAKLGISKQLGINNRDIYSIELLNFPGLYQQMWPVLCAKRHDAEVLCFSCIDNLSRSYHGYLTLFV